MSRFGAALPTLPTEAAPVGLAVDVAAFALHAGELRVLLTERGGGPHAHTWALPGGFVQEREGLGAAALRVLRVETGLDLGPRHLEQFFTFGEPERDPRGRVVSVGHLAVLPHGTVESYPAQAGPHTQGAAWLSAHDPPALAFDHALILSRAVKRLQLRLEYADLAPEFLPDTFTLPELQTVHEAVLGRTLDKRNFRKRVLAQGRLSPAGERRSGVGRPALLYSRVQAEEEGTV